MRPYVIKVPDIGEGIAEVELSEWHVQPGDQVSEDQPLADVMTEKASVEIPSPVAGTVVWLGAEVGQMIAVGAELIHIEVAGEASPPGADKAEQRAAAPAPSPPSAAAAPVPAPAPTVAPSPAPSEAPVPQRRAPGERPIASPSVRRRAWELDIDLAAVQPSGPGGRIMHADLDRHVGAQTKPASPQAGAQAAPAPARQAGGDAASRKPADQTREGEQSISVTGVRRKIAERMQQAKRRIPHFTYVEEVDVTELEALRAQLNQRWAEERGRLTVLPFLMRAVVLAVSRFPQINARFDDDAGVVTRFAAVHLGVATQTASGLMVPVIRHAEALDLWGGAAAVSRLAQAARSGRATREELTGSTLTITSLGPLGGIASTPVINYPEVAIVGVNRIVERPMLRNGLVVGRLLMNLSSSFDHRVIDGQDAAEFVQALRGYLESPATLFID